MYIAVLPIVQQMRKLCLTFSYHKIVEGKRESEKLSYMLCTLT